MSDRPNIVLIVPDDMGYGDFGCFNNGLRVQMPCERVCQRGRQGMASGSARSRESVIAAQHILGDRAGQLEALDQSGIESPDLRATLESSSSISGEVENESDAAASMPELIERVELRDDGIRLTLKIQIPCSCKSIRTPSILNLSRFVPLRLKRRGDRRAQFPAAAE